MTRPPEMACRTCRYVLNTTGIPPTYLHPAHRDGIHDHHPDPVPADQLDIIRRDCDFCGDPHPVWTIHGRDLTAVALGTDAATIHVYGEDWAACAGCELLIGDRKLDQLAHRAAAAIGISRPDSRQRIAAFHRDFLEQADGRRTLITTTAWPATPLQARDLPKVRDRLSRLHRQPDQLPPTIARTAADVADGLERAQLIWVDDEFTDLAEAAATNLPPLTVDQSLLPADNGLLVWARPIQQAGITAASWTTRDDGWEITTYRTIGEGLHGPTLQRVREHIGWLAPIRIHHLTDRQLLPGASHPGAALATTWLLIAQQVAAVTPAPIDKATRRAYARTGRPAPDVRVVHIRPQAHRGQQPVTSSGSRRPLGERVWVTPHWRNVAYGPSKSLRRPTWIGAFLRGPDDAPIKASTTVRVLRAPKTRREDVDG